MGISVGLHKIKKKVRHVLGIRSDSASVEEKSKKSLPLKDSFKDEILLYMAQLSSDELNELVNLSRQVRRKLRGGRISSGLTESLFNTTGRISQRSSGPIELALNSWSDNKLYAGGKAETYRYTTTTATTSSSMVSTTASGTFVSPLSPGSRMVRRWKSPSSEFVPIFTSEQASKLMQKVFPTKVLRQLQWDMGENIEESHTDVSIFFSDIVGFTSWCSMQTPGCVLECLSAYFQILDDLAERSGVYKVETIGDAWMAICGAPKMEPAHASIMGHFALEVQGTLRDLKEIFCSREISLRIGLHCGPVQSGVVRADRPRFQVFGDAVNMASRMESTSLPGMIQISQDMYNAFKQSSLHFSCTSRGLMEIKGKGMQETFFLNSILQKGSVPESPIKFSGDRLTIFNPVSSNGRRGLTGLDAQDDIQLRNPSNTQEFTMVQRASSSACTNCSPARLSSQSLDDDGQMAILLVDDAPSIRMQYRRVLSKTGCTVYTAKNGLEAFELMIRRQFTCVLMDIFMPEMNGYQCVEHFRKWESKHRTRRQPITALSGEEFTLSMVDDLRKSGFDDFLSKNNTIQNTLKHVAQGILDSRLSDFE